MAAFRGRLAFCSNFFTVPHGIHGYPTVEHFFVAMKTTDQATRSRIKHSANPGAVKRMGRRLALRPDWDQIKLTVMAYALALKFAPGTDLAADLLATGSEELVEVNGWHDNFWGDCRCNYQVRCDDPGLNHLGRLLMERRMQLGGSHLVSAGEHLQGGV